MSDNLVPIGAGVLAVAIIGFSEGITWIITPVVAAGVLALGVLLLSRQTPAMPRLHGHGDTRRRAQKHEDRHQRVLTRLGVRSSTHVWKEGDGWAGETKPDPAGWAALTAEQKAAVYMAGALGPSSEGEQCYEDDLAAVDWLGVSRGKAKRIAKRLA